VRAGAWSPSPACGIGYAFLDRPVPDALASPNPQVFTAIGDGTEIIHAAPPFLDPDKQLARGLPLD